nr:hypothetical protein [Microbacterium testaceum]
MGNVRTTVDHRTAAHNRIVIESHSPESSSPAASIADGDAGVILGYN